MSSVTLSFFGCRNRAACGRNLPIVHYVERLLHVGGRLVVIGLYAVVVVHPMRDVGGLLVSRMRVPPMMWMVPGSIEEVAGMDGHVG